MYSIFAITFIIFSKCGGRFSSVLFGWVSPEWGSVLGGALLFSIDMATLPGALRLDVCTVL